MTDFNKSEIFFLYLDPNRRGEGIGTQLLNYITDVQIEKGAKEQWLSVQKGNYKGIPFYEAMGFTKDSKKMAYSNISDENYVSLGFVREI